MNANVAHHRDLSAAPTFDVERVRADFPTLERRIHDRPLVYLDSAASALTPSCVIERITRFYRDEYSNIHRGAHTLSAEATAAYEQARQRVASFLGAATPQEIVFTSGCTEALNLVAQGLGALPSEDGGVGEGDEVVITELEHHSNFLPWQRLCETRGATLKVAPVDDDGQLDLEAFAALLSPRTQVVAVAHVSNVLGTILPIATISELAHGVGATVVVDGAQGAVHKPVDVQALGCDVYTLAGHKLYGPTGIGALWGKKELLDRLPPYQVGGGTIDKVAIDGSTYLESPLRFEAGTPNIVGALGLETAIAYLEGLDMRAVEAHEQALFATATAALSALPQVRILGEGAAGTQASVRSFVLDDVHPADAGAILDRQGIAVRIGHHCAQPLMRRFGVPATTRASFGVYNSASDVEALIAGIEKVIDLFFG